MKKHYRDQHFIDKVGRRILEVRKLKNITQEQLSYATGFELKQIEHIERGESNTTISSIVAIAEALVVPAKDLFDFSELE